MLREVVARRDMGEGLWRTPLVGFAAADDPIWHEICDTACPGHAMPDEMLKGARTAIACFIPFTKRIVDSNADAGFASALWARAYVVTNELLAELGRLSCDLVAVHGGRTAMPPPTHNVLCDRPERVWSHRHAAFAAGLGSFGLNRMLITESGCAGRLMSFVTDLAIKPTRRSAAEGCLAKRGLSCGVCLKRCPLGVLGKEPFDRERCYELCLTNGRRHESLGPANVCGKCVAALPCSISRP